ncbi:MAG: AmmeMemoRadiSam system radical SAM enzyme [Armatimonadota bacterium]|nr:MAG: AmmeMemoRadiSam system radical SAM enzyme [Armatimonadota bacterium]
MFYDPPADGRIRCRLCPHECRIADGKTGVCRVRQQRDGTLYALTYSEVTSVNLDPIEKKPLYHFHPGSWILSLGTLGCNLACDFCQNWQISQEAVPTRTLTPQQAVEMAQREPRNVGLAFTYNEPLIWYEYVHDTALLARERGLKTVLVTNGFINEEPLRELLPAIDALNIDVKSYSDDFYRTLCKGRAAPVRRTAEIAHAAGCLVELTNLIIPGYNDGEDDVRALVDWVAGLDPAIPLHFSRYHPAYKLDAPPTPVATLRKAYRIAAEKLNYVYLGNVMDAGGEDTQCPSCGETVIARQGFSARVTGIRDGKCTHCDAEINITGI